MSMPRPLVNNPLGVSDSPNYITDPVREAETAQEFVRKCTYLINSFRSARRIEAKYGTFAASVRRMKNAVSRTRGSKRKQYRLHPLLELAISKHAHKFAAERTSEINSEVTRADIMKAAITLSETIDVKQGARNDTVLRHHVEGFMALVQETSGKPVTSQKTKNSVYDPHLSNFAAQHIFELLHAIDPKITVTKVGNIIREARKSYAGKHMRYADFFPSYGASMNDDGEMELAAPYHVTPVGFNFPIYCS
jgi:hypothetical protein